VARTPLFSELQNAVSAVAEAEERRVSPEQVTAERRATRREFLERAGVAGAAALGAAAFGRLASASGANPPRIVIVGGGLAGLTCAYRLQQAGLYADVYEASSRIGGRCWTIRDVFSPQVAEHGGELIDQGHTQTRRLAQELGLKLANLLRAEPNGSEDFYSFDGVPYTYAQATADLNGVYQKLHKDVSAASYPTLFDSYTQRGYELDHLSIVDWIEESVPGGMGSKLGRLLDIAYTIEYGADSSVQSSLNLVYLLGYTGQGQLNIFGKWNEKYHVVGGNDQLATLMASQLSSQIHTGYELVAIKLASDGATYTLTFKQRGGTSVVSADHVVLALPFSILRSSVDYTKAGFEPLKVTAITELGMGTNSKLHVQFSKRQWYDLGNNGNTYADTGYQNTWEVTRAQGGKPGILVDYTGGTIGASFGQGTAASRAKQFLQQVEPVLPGLSGYWNGKAALDFWPGYEWTKGSYSYWKVGQYTAFAGMERKRQGTCHFAGEHTSIDFQGYLNGAVESGERVVSEILGDVK
jgi:monoamine oxidase